jgi:glyoxylase-like metal-dependent hydrolase (beta-lactamase superfamily II)
MRNPFWIPVVLAATLAACSKTEDAPAVPATPAAEPAVATAVVNSENVHAFAIGDLQALALRDGGIEVPNDNSVFGVGQTPEAVAAVLSANGLATDKLALSIQPLLVRAGDRVLLFDTGAGGAFGPGSGKLPAAMSEAGVAAASVTDIFISHVHGDHIGGLVDAQAALNYPNATVHLAKAEWDFLSGLKEDAARSMGLANHASLVAALSPKVAAFAPGAELVPEMVKAVDIQGHTPGHSGYLITSGDQSLLYVGDSMHHFVVSVQKPEWTIAFDHDSPTATASRQKLIADSAAQGQRIYAVHFPFPGTGRFERKGEGFAWLGE